MISVVALYQFKPVFDCLGLIRTLKDVCEATSLKGTLLVAPEGINGTVAGVNTKDLIQALKPTFDAMEIKESFCDKMPFLRMKVRLKKEIVTMGVEGVSPIHRVGTYVEPHAWNHLIQSPDVTLIDTRNAYEVSIGTFKGAIDPGTRSFREFPAFVDQHLSPKTHPKVAMWCTGGIRCEKASSYLLRQGFKEVYHLKGGILKYLETVKPENSLWEGECFVFDGRVAVGSGVEQGTYTLCYSCRHPLNEQDLSSPKYSVGVSCPNCYNKIHGKKLQRRQERQHQIQLSKRRGTTHMGQ